MSLRAVRRQDYDTLHAREMESDVGPRWRFRGATPTPEWWSRTALSGVLAQFFVVSAKRDAPIGLVLVHDPAFQDGFASVSALRFDSAERPGGSPTMLLGVALLIRYAFACWNFRKLYMDVAEYNYGQFASGVGKYFVMEGRRRAHYFAGGRYWDEIQLAIYREEWPRWGEAILRHEAPV